MKKSLRLIITVVFALLVTFSAYAQNTVKAAKPDTTLEKKAATWSKSLNLSDTQKELRITNVISTHLTAIRDWNNEHPFTLVPAGINPVTGKKLSELDRQIIANSSIPATVHAALMTGLRKDLNEAQTESILDKYTVGKVAFTLAGYHSIVPNMTAKEDSVILVNLKEAREQAIDYKNMKQISAIFEIYKTKSEQYFNANGRNWRDMYRAYTAEITKAKKAALKPAN